ncbi:GntP family permease [Alkalicoccobacillus porphyridii]|uniref:GntP family permease n=1 Tax=Alkalicoccobacillus porphyridii TaxID=2597270 RepID=A0A554A146_9BACI|nr:SLC13 family permease [Alkalicoccobacillus porphyridii]TSB47420.1 GntP family permease [Alkalicoccobacillus porphyridii]
MLSFIGLIFGLALLIYLTIKGMNLLISAPIAAFIVAITSDLGVFPQLVQEGEPSFLGSYMEGFSGFVATWFFMFLIGAVFGKLMGDSGAADSVAQWIVRRIGLKNAPLAIVIACAILTYGGVSLFVVAFAVYPMAISLFKEANLPRRFIPAALGFGSVTFTMTSAGSPEIQNWIPIPILNTSPYAAWEVSLVVAVVMMIIGYWWLRMFIQRAVKKGETFVLRVGDPTAENKKLPHPVISFLPLLTVLAVSFTFHDTLEHSALIVALLSGSIMVLLFNYKYFVHLGQTITDGTTGALIAIGNTAAVVGFGGVARNTHAFSETVAFMTDLPGNPLIGSAVAILLIAGITGSSSGGQTIALPLIAPHYMDMGVPADQIHRVAALSSGVLDSLPHGGYTVTTIASICRERYQDAYPAYGAVTVIVPFIGLVLAIVLFSLGM